MKAHANVLKLKKESHMQEVIKANKLKQLKAQQELEEKKEQLRLVQEETIKQKQALVQQKAELEKIELEK